MATLKRQSPLALFDALENIAECVPPQHLNIEQKQDFNKALEFLKSYEGSNSTFNAYRREIERLLQWCWLRADKTLKTLTRDDIQDFIKFCQNPLKSWIGQKKATRFIVKEGRRIPNPEWRPFVVTLSKAAFRQGSVPDKAEFELSDSAIKDCFAILSSFYNYLLQDDYVSANPVALIRQKNRFLKKHQGQAKIRRLSELQWKIVIDTASVMAERDPAKHERTLFIMSALYLMYLRISELAASKRWVPTMNDFHRDQDGLWWFTTVGKGNKERDIAVSDSMMKALVRWRKSLDLSLKPTPADDSPLLPKHKGRGPITSTTYIREIVQVCFDEAAAKLYQLGHDDEAIALTQATVHWLRHTGISEDVKTRPREHVRDDAGHSSGATTDRYIDVERKERHRSARKKPLSGSAEKH